MIQNKKTDIPPELFSLYQAHERKASKFLENGDFVSAEQEYRFVLSEILHAQGNNTRYHKGGPYHQIGYCLFLQDKGNDALKYFQYAFIEDCMSIDNFPKLPAFLNLNHVYKISYGDLHKLFSQVKKDIAIDTPLNPEGYLEIYTDSRNKIESIDLTKEKKVFVGGNYKNIVILRYIQDEINELGKSPILAIDFKEDISENIYFHSMLLLKDCGSAIFEITFDSGHLMEIESAFKGMPEGNILLLFQKKTSEEEEHYITKMLLGVGVKPVGYMRIGDLKEIIKKFLNNIKPALTETTGTKTSVSITAP